MGNMFSAATADATADATDATGATGATASAGDNDNASAGDNDNASAGAGDNNNDSASAGADATGAKAPQSGGEPRVTIDIFGSEKKNSKGFLINDIKITPQNLNSAFSSKDQVEHFLTNVFGYVKNSNLPKDEQQPTTNFFHSYKKNIVIEPTQSGGKKKRSRKHKLKSRHRKTKKH